MGNEDVEKFLAEQKAFEDRRQALIAELLKKRERQNKEVDDELAKLGHRAAAKPPSHHKKTADAKGKNEKR